MYLTGGWDAHQLGIAGLPARRRSNIWRTEFVSLWSDPVWLATLPIVWCSGHWDEKGSKQGWWGYARGRASLYKREIVNARLISSSCHIWKLMFFLLFPYAHIFRHFLWLSLTLASCTIYTGKVVSDWIIHQDEGAGLAPRSQSHVCIPATVLLMLHLSLHLLFSSAKSSSSVYSITRTQLKYPSSKSPIVICTLLSTVFL